MANHSSQTQQLLTLLYQQIQDIKTEVNASFESEKNITKQRFDISLFKPVVRDVKEYLIEMETHYKQLQSQAANNNVEQVIYLAEKLFDQIAALKRELATQSLRMKEQKHYHAKTTENSYQKLAQYQDYQRRLKNMIRDKENLLSAETALPTALELQKQIAVLEARYQRCSNAIKALEHQIEKNEIY